MYGQKRWIEYHSREWEYMVDTGWITWVVILFEEIRMATMIWIGRDSRLTPGQTL